MCDHVLMFFGDLVFSKELKTEAMNDILLMDPSNVVISREPPKKQLTVHQTWGTSGLISAQSHVFFGTPLTPTSPLSLFSPEATQALEFQNSWPLSHDVSAAAEQISVLFS